MKKETVIKIIAMALFSGIGQFGLCGASEFPAPEEFSASLPPPPPPPPPLPSAVVNANKAFGEAIGKLMENLSDLMSREEIQKTAVAVAMALLDKVPTEEISISRSEKINRYVFKAPLKGYQKGGQVQFEYYKDKNKMPIKTKEDIDLEKGAINERINDNNSLIKDHNKDIVVLKEKINRCKEEYEKWKTYTNEVMKAYYNKEIEDSLEQRYVISMNGMELMKHLNKENETIEKLNADIKNLEIDLKLLDDEVKNQEQKLNDDTIRKACSTIAEVLKTKIKKDQLNMKNAQIFIAQLRKYFSNEKGKGNPFNTLESNLEAQLSLIVKKDSSQKESGQASAIEPWERELLDVATFQKWTLFSWKDGKDTVRRYLNEKGTYLLADERPMVKTKSGMQPGTPIFYNAPEGALPEIYMPQSKVFVEYAATEGKASSVLAITAHSMINQKKYCTEKNRVKF